MGKKILVSLESADELHDCVYTQTHRVQIENMRKLLRVHFVQTLLEHLGFLEVWLLTSILASRKKDL